MIIISGWLRVRPGQRERMLAASAEAMRMARKAEGCRAFVVAADPLDDELVNVYEQWDNEAALLTFRGERPEADMQDMIVAAEVRRYEIASIGPA